MKKLLLVGLALICFIAVGCQSKAEKVVEGKVDPSEMTQEELNELTKEEVNKLNGPDGKSIEVNQSIDLGEEYHIEVQHYYKLEEGVYVKMKTGYVRTQTPSEENEQFIVTRIKVTNKTGEEVSGPSFDIVSGNGEKTLGRISSEIVDPYGYPTFMPGAVIEGNIVGIAPRDDDNLTLMITWKEQIDQELPPVLVKLPKE